MKTADELRAFNREMQRRCRERKKKPKPPRVVRIFRPKANPVAFLHGAIIPGEVAPW